MADQCSCCFCLVKMHTERNAGFEVRLGPFGAMQVSTRKMAEDRRCEALVAADLWEQRGWEWSQRGDLKIKEAFSSPEFKGSHSFGSK